MVSPTPLASSSPSYHILYFPIFDIQDSYSIPEGNIVLRIFILVVFIILFVVAVLALVSVAYVKIGQNACFVNSQVAFCTHHMIFLRYPLTLLAILALNNSIKVQ